MGNDPTFALAVAGWLVIGFITALIERFHIKKQPISLSDWILGTVLWPAVVIVEWCDKVKF